MRLFSTSGSNSRQPVPQSCSTTWHRQIATRGKSVGHLVLNDPAERGIRHQLVVPVTHPSEVKVVTIPYVTLVLLGPLHESVVLIAKFQAFLSLAA